MKITADKSTLTALTVANLVCCPLYLLGWLFGAAAVGGNPQHAWQSLFLGALLLLAGACLVVPFLAWGHAGRRPRAALVAMIAPIAPLVGGFALMQILSVLSFLVMPRSGCGFDNEHPCPAPRQQKTYAETKELLKKNNFEPMALKHAHDNLLCGAQFCVERPEAFYCSGVGVNFCDFAFTRRADGQILIAETYGDDSIYVHEVRQPNKLDSERIAEAD